MKYKQSIKDPRIIEDQMGEPTFKHIGLHTSDVTDLLADLDQMETKIYELEKQSEKKTDEIEELKERIEELEQEITLMKE